MSEDEQPNEKDSAEDSNQTDAQKSSNISLIVMITCIVVASLSLIFYFKKKGNDSDGAIKGLNGEVIKGNLVDGKECIIYL